MNELDLKTKIEGLEKAIKEHQDFTNTYQSQLKSTQQELVDYNKPEITPMMMDEIHNAVERAIENYSFSEPENYEVEFGMEYDGRVHLESIDLQDTYQLVEIIVDKVCKLFKEAECPEDTPEKVKYDDELNKE